LYPYGRADKLRRMDNSDRSAGAAITPDELHQLMTALGLNQAGLSRAVAVDRSTPGRWLSGAVPVPLWLVEHLRLLLALQQLCWEIWTCPGDDQAAPLPNRLEHLKGDEKHEIKPTESILRASILFMDDQKASAESHTVSPEYFREALQALRWKQSDFVRRVGCAKNTASRWAQGVTPIPAWVGVHLALLIEVEKLHGRFVRP
jgi:DNA-binding transcriptional regulator YiaG